LTKKACAERKREIKTQRETQGVRASGRGRKIPLKRSKDFK